MEAHSATVLRVGLQMVEKHPVATVPDGIRTVLPPSGVDPHAGKGVSLPTQSLLQRGVVVGEAAVRLGQILVWAEGDFQRVIGAVEGKLVARVGIGRAVDVVHVVAHLVGEWEAGEEVIRRRMDGGEVRRRSGRAVPNRKLKLNAHAPRALAAQRCEETCVERIGDCRFLFHVREYCTMRQPPKGNRK